MSPISAVQNPWDTLRFSGNSKIHLDSFLSAFQIAGMKDEYYYNGMYGLNSLGEHSNHDIHFLLFR